MIIQDIQVKKLTIPLNQTFKTALRQVSQIENICLKIVTDTEYEGYGCAAPTAVITGETASSIISAVSYIRDSLVGKNVENLEQVLQVLNTCMKGNFSAKASVDMALYDLFGKMLNAPLCRLLGGHSNDVHTDMTISIDTLDKMAGDSLKAVEQGFQVLKIKVGNDPELDFLRLKKISEVTGPDIKLRIDANQGWKPKEAILVMDKLTKESISIELLEQPVRAGDYMGMKFVRDRVSVPVIADESVFTQEDAFRILEMDAVDGINIKLMKCGGIFNALKIAAIAESAGVSCMIGSMMECSVSVSAAVHLAKAKSCISRYDLDAPLFCTLDPSGGAVSYEGADVSVTELPGLGIQKMDVF